MHIRRVGWANSLGSTAFIGIHSRYDVLLFVRKLFQTDEFTYGWEAKPRAGFSFQMRVRENFVNVFQADLRLSLPIKLPSFPHTLLSFGCYGYMLPQRHHDWWFLDVSMLSSHTQKDPVSRSRSWYRNVLCCYCELQQWLQHKLWPLHISHYQSINMAGCT
jgi:hypothetical protein